jgi:hypothetical protein
MTINLIPPSGLVSSSPLPLGAQNNDATTSVPESPSRRRPPVPIFPSITVTPPPSTSSTSSSSSSMALPSKGNIKNDIDSDNDSDGKFLNEIEDEVNRVKLSSSPLSPTLTTPTRYWLESVRPVANNTRIYSFRLVQTTPPQAPFNLPVGQHLYVIVPATPPSTPLSNSTSGSNDDLSTSQLVPIRRAYTPIGQDAGGFELLVKTYANGPASSYIASLRPGQQIQVLSPFGGYKYQREQYRHVVMLAAGTGITPMYQVHIIIWTSLIACLYDP